MCLRFISCLCVNNGLETNDGSFLILADITSFLYMVNLQSSYPPVTESEWLKKTAAMTPLFAWQLSMTFTISILQQLYWLQINF